MLIEPEGVASAADAGPASFTSSTTKPAVTATNTGKGNGLTAHAKSAPAIHGSQTSTAASGVGVRGTIDSTNGAGTGRHHSRTARASAALREGGGRRIGQPRAAARP